MRRRLTIGLILATLLLAWVYTHNASRLSARRRGFPFVLAHRGVSQQYDSERRTRGCEAARMQPPTHDYIENTIRSMQAAFDRGATVVEFDVQLTEDRRWAVFHDRRLECRTDGAGFIAAHTMAELKTLDVAYGYTADDGRTFPFRGQGIGAMPSIEEVFDTFPNKAFIIDLKANDRGDGGALAATLGDLDVETQAKLTVFGAEGALEGFHEKSTAVKTFSFASIRNCLLAYIGFGWTGFVPRSCHAAPLYVPINVAPFLWGWPNRFMERMEAVGSPIVVVGPFGRGSIAAGMDTEKDLQRLPRDYNGGIWTNDVAFVAAGIERLRHNPR